MRRSILPRHILRDGMIAVALLAAIPGCKTTADLIADGDRLRSEKQYDQALERYREALERSDIGGSERERADRAQGEIRLEKGDLNGAQASFGRLPATSGARAALLGRVAMARGDRAAAEASFREAWGRGERGTLGRDLAEIVGGEAQTPEKLLEAAHLVRDSGEAALAQALEEGAHVWEAMSRGEPPLPLDARLEAARPQAPRYAILALLHAELLSRAGDAEKSDAAWEALATQKPKPSDAFVERGHQRRAGLALSQGDLGAFERALRSLPPEQAAAERARRARSLEATGDTLQALALFRQTADAGGAPAARAWCEVARLEGSRGRRDATAEAWARVLALEPSDPETLAILALGRARGGDPLGARSALESAAKDGSIAPGLKDEVRRVHRAAGRLAHALAALIGREPGRALELAQAAEGAAPGLPGASAVERAGPLLVGGADDKKAATEAALVLDTAPVSSDTRAAFVGARTSVLLQAGLFEDAVKTADTDRAATVAALVAEGPRAIFRLLSVGRVEDAAHLFEILKAKGLAADAAPLLERARSDAGFGALWIRPRFVAACGSPDPCARRAPYSCDLTLDDGAALGLVHVTAVTEEGLEVRLPGRDEPVHVRRDRLSDLSLRGVPDREFERADALARGLAPSKEER